jgi:hypothetical protein
LCEETLELGVLGWAKRVVRDLEKPMVGREE